ncbi:GNAT family N-acetyltransferase [Nostoc sp. CHAB 5844]|nr:GNAT family N-acetyltransferase [Nostoc sp. CHAB 5844]
MTTANALNQGRVFNGTARPATDKDIAILAPGDWIKEKDDPYCYQFKRWDFWNGEMAAIGWEGKEFIVPSHLLMVCIIVEGQLVEKFFKSEIVASHKIFNKLKAQLGFTSIFELSDLQIELVEGIGACCYYVLKKSSQITIRKLAVLPEHQKQGWGRLLIYRVICRAIEKGKTSIFLKCPIDLPANNFYENLGFELEATEQDRTRPLNYWRYHIKLPLLFYCGSGGKSKYDAIATAPNLGKVFNGTAIPATDEDIAILSSGDWIKEKDNPWCYHFKKWDGDMCIGVWEGDEFFVPRHLLMVVEVLEGKACEKFFRSLEKRNLKETEISTDYSQLKVGDRIRITQVRNRNLSHWIGCEAEITSIDDKTIGVLTGEGKQKKYLTLKHEWYTKINKEPLTKDKVPSGLYVIGPSCVLPLPPSQFEGFWRSRSGLHPTIAPTQEDDRFIRCDILPVEEQICLCQQHIIQQNWRIQDLESQPKQNQLIKDGIKSAKNAIASEETRIDQLLEELIVYRQLMETGISPLESKKAVLNLIAN